MLAAYYRFDLDEAREIIGIAKKKRERVSGNQSDEEKVKPKCNGEQCKQRGRPKKQASQSDKVSGIEKANKEEKKRGPNGYHLFMRDQGLSFTTAGDAWKKLSDKEREKWIQKAKN